MAEIAIPIMALGGFYVIANHNKKENFEPKNETPSIQTKRVPKKITK